MHTLRNLVPTIRHVVIFDVGDATKLLLAKTRSGVSTQDLLPTYGSAMSVLKWYSEGRSPCSNSTVPAYPASEQSRAQQHRL